MKRLWLVLLAFSCLIGTVSAQEHLRYALMWHDEFNSGPLDTKAWSKIYRGKADWAIYMSSADTLYAFDKGDLVLRGMVNTILPNDKAEYLTGGVWGKHKKAFGFGRIEVRAKFDVAYGYWPAIWMLPEANHDLNWPYGGEIDIMEHFRDNPFVNHTVHSHYTFNLGKRNRPSHVKYPEYNEGEYNVYGMERYHDSLVFFLNGKRTMNYPRHRKGVDGQFPFSQHDYYLILDSQIGHDRSPYIDNDKMPVELRIDYVRYYEVDTKTDVIPEPQDYQQYTRKRYKFRKIVVNTEETFDDADAYHIVTKRGKAIVSGNVVWAKSTLDQLIGDDGKIANVDFYDQAACPKRGISLDKMSASLTFEELNMLLDWMAMYKLNGLQWNGKGALTEAENEAIRNRATALGIEVFGTIAGVPTQDCLEAEGNAQFPASSRIFLHSATGKGGLLYLKGLGEKDKEAVMAFAERYWRGGDAGEGTVEDALPEALSTAGTRLANFNERVDIHKTRFRDKK